MWGIVHVTDLLQLMRGNVQRLTASPYGTGARASLEGATRGPKVTARASNSCGGPPISDANDDRPTCAGASYSMEARELCRAVSGLAASRPRRWEGGLAQVEPRRARRNPRFRCRRAVAQRGQVTESPRTAAVRARSCNHVRRNRAIHGNIGLRQNRNQRPHRDLRGRSAGLSSRRSRVRVPSLPPLLPARWRTNSRPHAALRRSPPPPRRSLTSGSSVRGRAR